MSVISLLANKSEIEPANTGDYTYLFCFLEKHSGLTGIVCLSPMKEGNYWDNHKGNGSVFVVLTVSYLSIISSLHCEVYAL